MDVFVSYSGKDTEFVKKMCGVLKSHGITYWAACESSRGSSAEKVFDLISNSKVLLVFVSKNSNESKHVINELNCASMCNKPILPVVIDDVEISRNFEYYIANSNRLGYSQSADFVEQFVNMLRSMIAGYDVLSADKKAGHKTIKQNSLKRESDRKKKIIIAVIIAVVALIAVVVAAVAANIFSNSNNVVTNIHNKNVKETIESVNVPNFINLNYENEIKGNKDYEHLIIKVSYEVNTQYEYGVVIEQSPEKGEKVPEDSVIYITVNSKDYAIVDDVYGQSYPSAKQTLEANGFVTKYEMVYNTSVPEGCVINTSPERGETVPSGSTITLYVAINSDKNAVYVPNLVGFTPEDAAALAESVGLEIGEILPKDTLDTPGMVVEQVPAANETLHPGDKVDIYVSTGKNATVTTQLTVDLPDRGGETGSLKVYLNGVAVESAGGKVLLSGGTHTLTVSGSGQADKLIVKIDGIDMYSCTIDFTTNPITITDEKTINDAYAHSFYNNSGTNTIPVVVGKSESEAIQAVADKGFKNIVVQDMYTSNEAEAGVVLQQNPYPRGLGEITLYDTTTTITLYVGRLN